MASELRLQLTNEEALFARVEQLTQSIDLLQAEVLALKEQQGRSFKQFDEMIAAGLTLFQKISEEGLGPLLKDLMTSRRKRRRRGEEDAAPVHDGA